MAATTFLYDKTFELKDAGAVTSSGAAQVASAARILDLGPGVGRRALAVVVDVSAIVTAETNQKYEVEVQFSSSATFASDIVVANVLKLGHQTATGSSAATTAGRQVALGFPNQAGTQRRYMRLFTRVAGSGSPSINYTAFAVPLDQLGNA
jgi:hypothetical protein